MLLHKVHAHEPHFKSVLVTDQRKSLTQSQLQWHSLEHNLNKHHVNKLLRHIHVLWEAKVTWKATGGRGLGRFFSSSNRYQYQYIKCAQECAQTLRAADTGQLMLGLETSQLSESGWLQKNHFLGMVSSFKPYLGTVETNTSLHWPKFCQATFQHFTSTVSCSTLEEHSWEHSQASLVLLAWTQPNISRCSLE